MLKPTAAHNRSTSEGGPWESSFAPDRALTENQRQRSKNLLAGITEPAQPQATVSLYERIKRFDARVEKIAAGCIGVATLVVFVAAYIFASE